MPKKKPGKLKQALKRAGAIALSIALVLSTCAPSKYNHPKASRDFKSVSVQLRAKRSGGSGTILRSSDEGTDILTNEHVCSAQLEAGGIAILGDKEYVVTGIKPWSRHDLCLVHIKENLHISVELADKAPEFGDSITVSGYPLLQPLTVTRGVVSDMITIPMLDHVRPCTKEEFKQNPLQCLIEGVPIVKNQRAIYTSVLVQHGSSGSGVYNEDGKLVAVIFAMQGQEIGYGYAVPYDFVKQFVEKDSNQMSWTEVPNAQGAN